MMLSLERMIFLGGLLHLGPLSAGLLLPNVIGMRRQLEPVGGFLRRLVWVHGGFLVLTLLAFGAVSLALPGVLASGAPLSRAVCGFIALFWFTRLCVQAFVFEAKGVAKTRLLKAGYYGLTFVFAYFAVIYGFAALAAH
ncbi:MAG: hypothetical protein HY291_22550 [Planctomycetes bacterium]|nr:hypothetical protein [Planctomycetota bacterium]